jgi:hypothetical protein
MQSISLKTVLFTLGPIYWIAIALLYHGSYWSHFRINILEFAELTDIIAMSLFPVVSSIIGLVLGAIIGECTGVAMRGERWLFALFSVIIFLASLFFGGFEVAGLVIVGLLIINLYITKQSYEEFFSRNDVRSGAYGFLLLMLPMAFAQGSSNAEKVIGGRSYLYLENREEHRFIGHVSDTYLFYVPEKSSVYLKKIDSGETLNFLYHPKASFKRTTAYQNIFSDEKANAE